MKGTAARTPITRALVWFCGTLATSLTLMASPLPAPTPPYTLEDCLAIARERSLTLANADRDVVIARESVRGVRAQVFPALKANANYTRLDDVYSFPGDDTTPEGNLNTYAAAVSADQLLYSGGAVKAALRIASDYMGASHAERERSEADLTRRITRAFYEMLYLAEALNVADDSLRQMEAFEVETRARFESGTLSEFDWLSAKVALANERPRRIVATNALEVARRAFRDLIYLDDTPLALTGSLEIDPPVLSLEPLREQGLAGRPELRQALTQARIAQAQINIARSAYFPELRAFANYGGADPSQRNPFSEGWQWEWSAGLRASWSLLDGGLRSSETRTARLATAKAEAGVEELRRAVALEIERAWRDLGDARDALSGARETVALADRALAIAKIRFEQGLATYLNFTDSNLARNQARLNHQRALLACQQALADLRYAAAQPNL